MNRYSHLLPAAAGFAALLLATSCAGPCSDALGEGPAVITGVVVNPLGDDVAFNAGGESWTAPLTDSEFRLEVDIDEPVRGHMRIGREYTAMYLRPGEDLQLTIDLAYFDETVAYEGTGATINNYLAAKYLEDEGSVPDDVNQAEQLDEEAWTAFAAEREAAELALLEDHGEKAACMDPAFVAVEQLAIRQTWNLRRMHYPANHAYHAGDPDFEVSKDYWTFLDDVDLDDPSLRESEQYGELAYAWVSAQAERRTEGSDPVDVAMAQLDLIAGRFDGEHGHDLHARTVKNYIYAYGADGVGPLYEAFKARCADDACLAEVEQLYDQWKVLVQGHAAPGWAYPTVEGELVALDDLRDKVVYVDVWATWCGPCKKEIPHLDELQTALAGRDDIVFTSVSIDEDGQAWRDMVADKQLKGIQVHAKEAWESSIVKDYAIRGIPRFMVIDKEGNIGSANAPRPSTGKVEEMFLELAGGAATAEG